ncbi:MAG: pantoate--beta-alanine ligase, partial [Armatimonadota bacterium]
MRLAETIADVRQAISAAREGGWKVGLVPTMGALHEGHMALVRRARAECGFVVVSIFVNPTQFGPSEDYDRYPRALHEDARKCEAAGVDLVFAPSVAEMYPEAFDTWVEVRGHLTETLEGEARPGHFRGVTTVCAKLFNIVQPDCAYFGTKDYQQLKVIQKMVLDLNLPLEIVPCETVREPDGLAMSSRNAYLSPEERQAALVLNRALDQARATFNSGERRASVVQEAAQRLIEAEPLARIDYVAVRDADTLEPLERIDRPAVLLLAVR